MLKSNMFLEEVMAYFPFIRHGPHRKPKKLRGGHRETARRSHKPKKLREGGYRDTRTDTDGYTHGHRQQGNLISLVLFFQNKESRLKKGGLMYA
jgi:hypothetical protein